MAALAGYLTAMLADLDGPDNRERVRQRSLALCRRFPLPYRAARG